MYVDDMLIIGKKEQIQEFATKIQKEFSVKIHCNLTDYLGCEFHMNKEKTKGWLGQPSIIKSLVSILPGICPQLRTRIFRFVLS